MIYPHPDLFHRLLLIMEWLSQISLGPQVLKMLPQGNTSAYLSTFQLKRNSSTNAFGIKISLAFPNCDLKATTMF